MAALLIDEAAWSSRWRTRAAGEKAFLSLGLLAAAVTAPAPWVDGVVLLVAACLALVAGVPAGTYARVVAAPAVFVALGLVGVVVTLAPEGQALVSWGPFAVTADTLARGVETGARSFAGAAAVMLLATTTPMSDLLDTARRCRVPATVVEVAGVVYRMIFSLLDAQATVREAQAARLGYDTRRAALTSIGRLAAATLVRAWTHARALEEGLAGRGYTGALRGLAAERTVSVPFVVASAVLLTALAALSVTAGLR